MNKKNQGIEANLSVIAISAILVAALFVMSSSQFMPNAMAQNATSQAGGAANQTAGAAGGAANKTAGAAGGAANQTAGAAGGAANQTAGAAGGATSQSAAIMIPRS